MNKLASLLFAMLLLVGVIAGCSTSSSTPSTGETEEKTQENAETTEETAASFPVTITDATGQELTIETAPQKLISLVPSNTEIAYALGLLDNVIAVTDNDDYPAEAVDKEKIGGMEFNIEKIISLSPDLVLASEMNNMEGLEQIKNAGIPVLVVKNAASFDQVYESINMIGQATGTTEQAELIVNDMKERIAAVQEKAAAIPAEDKVKVWVEIWPAPDLYTTGKGTFMDEMLQIIGAVNAAGDQEGWPMFTEEDAVLLNPDVIVTTYGHVEGMENAVADVLSRSAWSEVGAVKEERVYNIEANIVERPGPRLVEGIEKLATLIYPDVFNQ